MFYGRLYENLQIQISQSFIGLHAYIILKRGRRDPHKQTERQRRRERRTENDREWQREIAT